MKKVIKGILLGIAGIFVLLILMGVIANIVSPGSSEDTKVKTENAADGKSGQGTKGETAEENSGEKDSTAVAEQATEEAKEITAEDVVIEEQVLLDQDGIKITAKELSNDSFWGPEVKVLVENTSSKSVTVQLRDVSVNGIMMEPMFSADVAAGKKVNDSITFMSSEFEEAGITMIQNMEFSFHVFDTESWDTVFDSDTIYLATNADGMVEQEVDKEGQLVLEQDGISIVIKEADSEDSFWGADIYVYVENTGDRNITVQARSVSINGFMVEPMFSCDVAAGKQAYDSLTFLESNLTENGIESIDNMEISFHIFDAESWDTILDSETINVSFTE